MPHCEAVWGNRRTLAPTCDVGYDAQVRTTIDLPSALHQQLLSYAKANDLPLSTTVSALAAKGLAALEPPAPVEVSPASGFPFVRLGRPITAAQVAELIDEEL